MKNASSHKLSVTESQRNAFSFRPPLSNAMAKEKSKPKDSKPSTAKAELGKAKVKAVQKQTSIKTFFGGGKADTQDAAEPSPDDDLAEDPDAPAASVAADLPPIHEIPDIFSDLVSRIPKIKDVAELVIGRKLRVATMCSGTESPLLALELIQKSISDQHGIDLGIEHVFSCEIEPFKQAYIERNFHPPLLFRDVCELGNDTAYVFILCCPPPEKLTSMTDTLLTVL